MRRRVLRRPHGAPLAAALLAALLGCGDGGTPPESDAFEGTYELSTINERELPHTIFASIGGAHVDITGGEIRPLSRGRLLDVRSYTHYGVGGTLFEVRAESAAFAYKLEGERLVVEHPGPIPSERYRDTAEVRGDVLSLRSRHSGVFYRNVNLRMAYVRRAR